MGVAHPTRQSVSVRDRATGLQYRFMMPGPPWTEADAAAAAGAILDAVTPGALVIPSGSLPPGLPEDYFLTLAPEVAARGGRVVIDTSGPALERAATAQAGLFVLRMDTVEAEELSGRTLTQLDDVAEMAEGLRAAGAAEIVMIAAGAQGYGDRLARLARADATAGRGGAFQDRRWRQLHGRVRDVGRARRESGGRLLPRHGGGGLRRARTGHGFVPEGGHGPIPAAGRADGALTLYADAEVADGVYPAADRTRRNQSVG